jgi:hypothetical protein
MALRSVLTAKQLRLAQDAYTAEVSLLPIVRTVLEHR